MYDTSNLIIDDRYKKELNFYEINKILRQIFGQPCPNVASYKIGGMYLEEYSDVHLYHEFKIPETDIYMIVSAALDVSKKSYNRVITFNISKNTYLLETLMSRVYIDNNYTSDMQILMNYSDIYNPDNHKLFKHLVHAYYGLNKKDDVIYYIHKGKAVKANKNVKLDIVYSDKHPVGVIDFK